MLLAQMTMPVQINDFHGDDGGLRGTRRRQKSHLLMVRWLVADTLDAGSVAGGRWVTGG